MSNKRSLRILVPFPSPFLYGAERTILETFDALRPEAESHFLLSQSAVRNDLPILGILKHKKFKYSFLSDKADWPVPGRPRSFGHLWRMFYTLIKFNLDSAKAVRGADILSLSNVQMLFSSLFACMKLRLCNKLVIFRFHELLVPWTPRNSVLKLAAPLVTDFFHHTNYSLERTLEANTFLKGKNNHVIPPITFIRGGEGSSDIKPFVGQTNVVFIGQVAPHKGVDLLLDAFEQIVDDREDVILHIIGGCSETYREEFHNRIGLLVKRDRVRYWGFREDTHSFLRMATVFVQPTRPSVYHESFGRGVVEAMAVGVPSICFRSGALQEIVVHNETGMIGDEETAECLAEAMGKFIGDKGFRDRCAENARKRYEEYYSVEVIKKKWLEFFDQKVHR